MRCYEYKWGAKRCQSELGHGVTCATILRMTAELSDAQKEQLAEQLESVPLFAELNLSQRRAIVDIAHTDRYRTGVPLYTQSEVDNTLYLVMSGQVALYHIDPQGVETLVGHRGPGDSMGEASVMMGEPHDTSAVAAAETRVLVVERQALRRLMEEDESLRARLTPSPETARKMGARQFAWLAEDEVVVFFILKHYWSFVRSLLVPLGVLAGAAVLSAVLPGLAVIAWIAGVVLSLPIISFLLFDWRNDFYVLTDRRLVHEENVPIIRQRREEAPLSAVQDVQFARNSFVAALLDFGDLTVETYAGGVAMKDVPHPEELKRLIFVELERVRSRARAATRKSIRQDLERRVGQQDLPAEQRPPTPQVETQPPPAWSILEGVFRYFFPRLREEVGDTITYRKHWVALFRRSRFPLLGLIFTLLATLIWWNRGFLIGLLPDSAWIIWPILLLVMTAWALWVFEDWRNDLYMITGNRVIDLQRVPFLLQETRKEAGLDRIQTSEVIVPTLWARLLGYGDVLIRVAGAGGEFRFVDVQHPGKVQAEVSGRVDQFKRRQAETEARNRRTELSDWFAVYEQIKSGYTPTRAEVNLSEKESDVDS